MGQFDPKRIPEKAAFNVCRTHRGVDRAHLASHLHEAESRLQELSNGSLPGKAMDFEESDIEASYPHKFVCADCFDDDHLKAFIQDAVTHGKCSYCGKRSLRKNIAAPIDDVIERMFESIRRRHGEAWASGCSWDSEDDHYVNLTWNTDDIIQRYVELPNDESGSLYQDISEAFPAWDWSSNDPWSSTEAEILQWGWERFVDAVKHKRRFFFTRKETEDESLIDRGKISTPARSLSASGVDARRTD
jgi:hypothetical protein